MDKRRFEIGKRRIKDNALKFMIWFFSFITVAMLAWILIYTVIKGIAHVNLEFLTTMNNRRHSGILPMIVNTLYIIIATLLISTPAGIGSAIYLTEYAKPGRIVRIIRFATETLSGIPSIIYGLFGLIFFVTAMRLGWSILSGALTLSIMVLPTVVRTTEEALKSVPLSYREGSFALGAGKLATIIKVVLPCAIPGILTALILGIGRVVGESAAVYLTAGTGSNIASGIMEGGRTLTVHLYLLAKNGESFEQAYATATVLLILVAVINYAAAKIAGTLHNSRMGKKIKTSKGLV